jgi:hypothetical protein
VLFPVHGCPGKLGRLKAIVEIPLAFRVGKEENLHESNSNTLFQ